MEVCDRCRKELVKGDNVKLDGQNFELCNVCSKYIADHIRNYKNPGGLGGLFK